MTVKRLSELRRTTGRIAGILLTLVLLFLADGLGGEFRQNFNEYPAIPGDAMLLNGPLPAEAESFADMLVEGAGSDLALTFEDTYKGFWYGGLMWKGTLRVAPQVHPGHYALKLKAKKEKAQNPSLVFYIAVYPDEATLRANAPTYAMRWFGASPFLIAALFLPLGGLVTGASYLIAHRLSQAMGREGRAEIYMLKKTPDGCHISAGLGTSHGVTPGTSLTILDTSGLPVGAAEVLTCTERECQALVSPECQARLGYFVSLHTDAPRQ